MSKKTLLLWIIVGMAVGITVSHIMPKSHEVYFDGCIEILFGAYFAIASVFAFRDGKKKSWKVSVIAGIAFLLLGVKTLYSN
jgi:uncharacterized membrane protein HdeD (DUF308 family)